MIRNQPMSHPMILRTRKGTSDEFYGTSLFSMWLPTIWELLNFSEGHHLNEPSSWTLKKEQWALKGVILKMLTKWLKAACLSIHTVPTAMNT